MDNKIIDAAMRRIKSELVIKNVLYLNVFTGEFIKENIAIHSGKFVGIGSEYEGIQEIEGEGLAMVPGFIDGHIHLESSIISPQEFCKTVLPHGTTAVITDPHEITNVLGCDGINYMMQVTKKLPMEVFFMVPSCVPCSPFDENGAEFDHLEVEKYMADSRVLGLAEMMNYVGTVNAEKEILLKIELAEKQKKAVDGHAPFLHGNELNAYVAAGVASDHECTNASEAVEKIRLGQWLMIREGTASRNLEALLPLLNDKYFRRCMFVTDDKHPGDLLDGGHIDYIIRKAIKGGVKPELAYIAGSFNAAEYFGLKKMGAIAPGYQADFVLLNDINSVDINSVYKKGELITEDYLKNIQEECDSKLLNKVYDSVHTKKISTKDIQIKKKKEKIIGLIPGELITKDEGETNKPDEQKDILKMCVVERHKNTGHIGVCFVKGYGLKNGAIATTIAHDSHNIIAIGTSDENIVTAVNNLIDIHGGMNIVENEKVVGELSLPIAGLMCTESAENVQQKMDMMKEKARDMGVSKGIDPYMTMSFASLPVIPKLKLTSLGVVDVEQFKII